MALADYLDSYDLLPALGFTSTDYDFMVTETLEALDIDAESESTDKILHLVGKVKYWERVVAKTSRSIDFSADGARYDASQINKQARENLKEALEEAMPYLPDYEIQIGSFSYEDPYQYSEDRESYL